MICALGQEKDLGRWLVACRPVARGSPAYAPAGPRVGEGGRKDTGLAKKAAVGCESATRMKAARPSTPSLALQTNQLPSSELYLSAEIRRQLTLNEIY